MDISKAEVTSSQSDLKNVGEASSPTDSSVHECSSETANCDQSPVMETNSDSTSETVMPKQQDSTQASHTEECEPKVKQNSPAEEKTPDSTATVDQSATSDKPTPEADDPAAPSQPGVGPTGGTDSSTTAASGTDDCYRYEGETCIYTDPSSGVEYTYSADQEGWVRRDGSGDGQPVHTPTLENCYYIGEHYCFRDAAGTVYRLDPSSNSWQEWTPPADSASPTAAAGETAAGAEIAAAAGTATETTTGTASESTAGTLAGAAAETAAGTAPTASDGRCFRDSDGSWCCRDDAGALCRWDAAAGRWQRVDTGGSGTSLPGRRHGPRKRRLNRGSSDDSEHDSDDEDDEPAAKRAPPVADRGGRGQDREGQERQDQWGQMRHEQGGQESDERDQEHEPPSDGSGYEWDAEKGAWFPKIDEEFLALHRLNYGFDSEGRAVETAPILESAAPPPAEPPPPDKQEAGKQRKLNTKKKPEWFQLDDSKNTKVYVSGLPDDTTEDEFVDLMSKCGLVMKDPLKKNAWKIKLYRDDYGVPKGDAICTYIKIESVNLALSILDGYEFKGKKLKVEKATFDMKGQFDPTKKPKKRALKKKDREKLQKKQEKLFAWQPDKIRGERERHERVVILKNLFSPEEFKTRPEAILEYQQDLRDECGKCGPVRKVVVHDRHKEGVAEVIFQDATDADACVQKMNDRWFAGRRLQAATWDGKTKYRVEETEEERAERLAKWEQFITGGDTADGDKSSESKTSESKPSSDKPSKKDDEPADSDKPADKQATESDPAESEASEEKPA